MGDSSTREPTSDKMNRLCILTVRALHLLLYAHLYDDWKIFDDQARYKVRDLIDELRDFEASISKEE